MVAKLPRFLVYPIVRYMLYFEFLMQKYILNDKHNLHTETITNKVDKSKIKVKFCPASDF